MTVLSEFSIGDMVVYPSHGVGKIVDEEIQNIAGTEIKLYVISLKKGEMTLRVPIKRVNDSGLRLLSSVDDIEKALNILASKPKLSKGMWSKRSQEYETKINSGGILSIAEVVRDLYKNVEDPERSYSERIIYESALNRLTSEYSIVMDVDYKEAEVKLLDLLKCKEFA